jgi:hypothetical protein
MIARLVLVLTIIKNCFTDSYKKEINIYDTENEIYYQMVNRTVIEQIKKHPYNWDYSLVDCFANQLEINTGKTLDGRKMGEVQLYSACLTSEIRRTIVGDEVLQLFSYYPSSITLDGAISSESYFSKREDFGWIDFDSDQKILDKSKIFDNMTQFLCNSQNECGNLEMVKNEKEGFHCYYKVISNQKISSNFTFVICKFNHTEENKIYEVASSQRINALSGEWEGDSYYIKRNQVYEKYAKSDHQFVPNLVVNQFALKYRKWINDTYYPQPSPGSPSPVDPVEPSEKSPSPVDPSPSPDVPSSQGLSAGVIILIIILCLAVIGGAGFAVWKFYFKKKEEVSLNQINPLIE